MTDTGRGHCAVGSEAPANQAGAGAVQRSDPTDRGAALVGTDPNGRRALYIVGGSGHGVLEVRPGQLVVLARCQLVEPTEPDEVEVRGVCDRW